MRTRIIVILVLLLAVGYAGLILRLYNLQITHGDEYSQMAHSQQIRQTPITAKRGSIYDTNGKTLALSSVVHNVCLSPEDFKDEEQRQFVATALAGMLDLDRDYILEQSRVEGSFYQKIKSQIEQELADQVTEFIKDNELRCVYLEETSKRYYPYGSLASSVLGFTGAEGNGAYGLESYYNSSLTGKDGLEIRAKNAWGYDMPSTSTRVYPAVNGYNLKLTIDEVVQEYLEANLDLAVREHEVKNRAVGIVMNIKTGEILAMATKPDFDPNSPWAVNDQILDMTERRLTEEKVKARKAEILKEALATGEVDGENVDEIDWSTYQIEIELEPAELLQESQFTQWLNKSISEVYEPGSVYKLITSAAALETHTVSPYTDYFTCNGGFWVAGNRIACWKAGGHGTISFAEGIKFSCNPTFIQVGQRLGAVYSYQYRNLFGFDETTGIDLLGESDAILHSLAVLSDPNMASLSSSSFGQTFKVTPIQLITAVNAAVGGGNLMIPYVVDEIVDDAGNIISKSEPKVKRQTISKQISADLALMAEAVVGDSDGSGRKSYVPGYRIGGKTGTSEKLDQMDENGETPNVLSFYGFAPVNDPTIGVLVVLAEPEVDNTFGSVIAAPVVGSLFTEILPYLGVEPSYTEEARATNEIRTPFLLGHKVHDAKSTLTQNRLKSRVLGDGTTVLNQVPGAGETIPEGGIVCLITDEAHLNQMVRIPDLIGQDLDSASRTLSNLGINVRAQQHAEEDTGTTVLHQSIEPGESVEIGRVITLTIGTEHEEERSESDETE